MTYVNGGSVIAVGVLLPAFGIAGVTARFYVRMSKRASLGQDDWLCLAALVGETRDPLAGIIIHSSMHVGLGDWMWNINGHWCSVPRKFYIHQKLLTPI